MFSLFPAKHRYERMILTGAFLIFLVFSVVLHAYHEPWRDEAQSWLIVQHDSFPRDIVRLSFNELTPMLWHLILYPFARAGAPYETEAVIHFVLIAAVAFLWMRHAPFSTLHKVLFLFGYFMAYEYNVIARNYVLTVLALFLVAAYFRTHITKPRIFYLLLLFLAGASIYGAVISLSLVLWHAVQKEKSSVTFFALISVVAFAVILVIYPATGLEKHLLSFFPVFKSGSFMWWNTQLVLGSVAGFLFAAIFILIPFLFLGKKPRVFFLYALTATNLVFALTVSNAAVYRHPGILFLFFIATLWIYHGEEEAHIIGSRHHPILRIPHTPILTVLLLLQVAGTAAAAYREIRYPFSHARNAAQFILEKNFYSSDTMVAGVPSPAASSILPFLSGRFSSFYIPEYREQGSFIKWEPFGQAGQIAPDEYIKRIEDEAGREKKKNLLVISTYALDTFLPRFSSSYERIASFDDGPVGTDEIFYIFEKKPNTSSTGR